MLDNADRNMFSGLLKGKRVVIGVTASISLYRVPDLIRDIRREGAQVFVTMSREAAALISPDIMEWASGNSVTTSITGKIEHITMFSGKPEDTAYALIPCTHNTMGKIANGISDDAPSSFYSFASGNGNRIMLAPAMHEGMYRNPANQRNAEMLKNDGVDIVPPQISEEKAKLSASNEILDHICRLFHRETLDGKKILIVGGHTEEPVDPVRSVANRGTGFTAYWFARTAFRLGASAVTYVGNCSETLPSYVRYEEATTSSGMEKKVLDEIGKGYDIALFPAAISDFEVENSQSEKMKSSAPHGISLKPRGKVIDSVRKKFGGVLVPFNLTAGMDDESVRMKFSGSKPDAVVSNSYTGKSPFGETSNDYRIITEKSVEVLKDASKPEMTVRVLRLASDLLNRRS